MGAESFLQGLLQQFYLHTTISSVPEISMREFGVGEFGKKISSRHLSFRNESELNSFLREKTPFFISYSNALYELPAARPMEKKRLLGADLVYEFDADEIKTDCKLLHDSWNCPSCGASGKGRVIACVECGSGTQVDEWVCPDCINEAKTQSLKLVGLLVDDFGFSDGIAVNFSGSKGFHIHVRSEQVRGLSKSARLELLDYVTATNLDLKTIGFVLGKKGCSCPKLSGANGWQQKVLQRVLSLFDENNAAKVAVMGNLTQSAAEKLLKEKHRVIGYLEKGLLLSATGINAERFWSQFLNSIVAEERLEVDRQTSIDINKIIRVPNTIHGSTGLQAKVFALERLPSADPLAECVVMMENEVKVMNAVAPRFYLEGKWFGPFAHAEVSLPVYAAFYLLARGKAELAGTDGVASPDRKTGDAAFPRLGREASQVAREVGGK